MEWKDRSSLRNCRRKFGELFYQCQIDLLPHILDNHVQKMKKKISPRDTILTKSINQHLKIRVFICNYMILSDVGNCSRDIIILNMDRSLQFSTMFSHPQVDNNIIFKIELDWKLMQIWVYRSDWQFNRLKCIFNK